VSPSSPTTSPPPTSPTVRARAAVVADEVAREAARAGVELDAGLLLWSLAGRGPASVLRPGPPRAASAEPAPPPSGPCGAPASERATAGDRLADGIGAVLERATGDDHRHAQGLHVTPRWLAEHLVALVLPQGPPPHFDDPWPAVCDPACGGGAFLLAAARHLHRLGADRRDVVRHLLWGADVDPVGLAAAEVALAAWAGEAPPPGRLVVVDPLLEDRSPWPDAPAAGFDVVAGNPPFQNQLGRETARPEADRRRLRERFGAAVRPYTDTAWLFLLVGCDLVRPGGRIVLVEPQSLVAARDAGAVRDAVERQAHLRELWVDDRRVFSAAVRVCAPVLERHATPPGAAPGGPTEVVDITEPPQRRPSGGVPDAGTDVEDRWRGLWADALGLPALRLGRGQVLGERATIVAGFRDQYYGLVDAVRELAPDDTADTAARLVTSGTLDWAGCTWGDRPSRFAKQRWQAPVVDLGRVVSAPPVAQRWVARTRVRKLVVATQTRVIEAAVDRDGTWVPSVPALAVVPADPDELWHLAAAVLSPAATVWLARRAAGTGLDRGALKVAAPDLTALPLPEAGSAWDDAALAIARFVARPTPEALDTYLAAIAGAYGTPLSVTDWWRTRSRTAVHDGGSDG
jgi:hypothetical protein